GGVAAGISSGAMRLHLALAGAALAALANGCAPLGPAPAPGSGTPAAPPVSAGTDASEQRALLLLLVDRQIFEPYTVDQALLGDAALREELARVLGQVPDPRAARTLRALVVDAEPRVRRAAAFSLGLHREVAEVRPALLRAVADPDA